MHGFKDNKDRAWVLQLDAPAAKRMKALAAADIQDAIKGGETNLIVRLDNDPCLLVEALYAALKPAIDALGLTPEDFAAGLGGCIDGAADAMREEIIDFFPRSRRAMLRAEVDKMKEATTAAVEKLKSLSLDSLLNSLPSSVSPPTAIPSESCT